MSIGGGQRSQKGKRLYNDVEVGLTCLEGTRGYKPGNAGDH